MPSPSEAVGQHLKQMRIICFAIVSGVVIFWGVVWYLLDSGAFTPPDGLPTYLATLFNMVALAGLVTAHLFPRLFRALAPDAPEERRLGWHRRNTILGFALREGAAFMALLGVLLTGQLAGGFALAGLAILAMVTAWPRMDELGNPL